MIQFFLNDQLVDTNQPAGMTTAYFICDHAGLKGTKLVCRENECSVCAVLFGELRR